jgi:hypothetical protein
MRLFVRPVPIRLIRHDDQPCFMQEGHGGKPVEDWPIYSFFSRYLNGEREAATRAFHDWYLVQYERYWNAPKSLGGMRGGSLSRLLKAMHAEHGLSFDGDPSKAEQQVLEGAVLRLVRRRFDLADDIRTNGYDEAAGIPVEGVRRLDKVFLTGGHHRVAILRALGRTSVPAVVIYPNVLILRAVRRARRLRLKPGRLFRVWASAAGVPPRPRAGHDVPDPEAWRGPDRDRASYHPDQAN